MANTALPTGDQPLGDAFHAWRAFSQSTPEFPVGAIVSRGCDETLLYRMKRTFSDGTQAIRFAAQELLSRLCALIPPARVHLTRYHGIFAPRARRRAALTGCTSVPRSAPLTTPPPVEE